MVEAGVCIADFEVDLTTAELRTELWPSDTFIEFDHSLNTAVKKIRQALGECPCGRNRGTAEAVINRAKQTSN